MLAAAVILADLCGAPPEPAAIRDPEDSADYTDVADAARAAGDLRTAVIAYRKAVALDAANRRAAAALAELCRATVEAGETDRLLAAIARYRAGDRAAAAAALAELVRGHGSSEAGAQFFSGLIALERHDTGTAIRAFERARSDPDYAALAAALIRLARRDGAIAAVLLIEPEVDSNPQLVPDTPPSGEMLGTPAADVDLLAVATVTARPAPWLSVRNALTWRDQRELSALDFVADDLEVAAELATGRHHVALRSGADFDLLDGSPYLVATRAAVAYRHDGDVVSPVASYTLRRREFLRDAERPFTGWVHSADAGVAVSLGSLALDARAVIRRELTADLTFTDLFAGGRLVLSTRPTAPVRFTATASAGYAHYDGAEADGSLRRDVVLEASADLEADLGDHVIAVAGVGATHNQSTLDDFNYSQVIARLGLMIAWGGL